MANQGLQAEPQKKYGVDEDVEKISNILNKYDNKVGWVGQMWEWAGHCQMQETIKKIEQKALIEKRKL